MPRSGSTWLFNAARLLLQADGDVSSGWIGDWESLSQKSIMLIKIHEFDSFMARRTPVILYSYRDLRDTLASTKRKFGIEPTIALARRRIAADRAWRRTATFVLRYESMLTDPEGTVSRLGQVLVSSADPRTIVARLAETNYQEHRARGKRFDAETLLHRNHVTDGRRGCWHEWLTTDLVRDIEREFHDWFAENQYPTSQS